EQPGAFHALAEPPYVINEPTQWLVTIGPYLTTLLTMLKHAAPLVGPVLGLTSDHLAKQLSNETSLMKELVTQLPAKLSPSDPVDVLQNSNLDVDYRALYSLLHQLDPTDHWAGLSRMPTPEGEILWLCRDHAGKYST